MNGMMLHCGSEAITRDELGRLPVPEARGPRHMVRPFIEDVEMVSDYMNQFGIRIQQESFGILWKNEMPARFFGLMQVAVPGQNDADGYGLMIGLRGSYDMSFTRALAVGSRVFVCDNLCFSGEIEIKTKQTLNIANRIPALLEGAVAQVPGMVEHQRQRFETYRNCEIPQAHGDALLTDCVRRRILNPSRLGKAIQEWDEPSHEEHAEQGFSLWRFHNAVTEAIKPSNQDRMAVPETWARTRRMTQLLDEEAGIAA